MNREEIIAGLIRQHDITFGTSKSTTTTGAMEELEKARKTADNIANLIERLATAKDAGIKISITPAHINSDYYIHTADRTGDIELIIMFGYRLGKMIGSGPDPIKALEVAHEDATKRITELQKHLEWLQEDVSIQLTDDQKRRIRDVIKDTGASEPDQQIFKVMSDWLTEYKKDPGHWDTVLKATKTLPLYMRQSTFLLGYIAHVFIKEEADNNGT